MDTAVRSIHWNALPEPTRLRLIEAFAGRGGTPPIVSQPAAGAGGIVGWIVLGLVCLGAVGFMLQMDYGHIWTAGRQGAGSLLIYVLALFLLGYSVLAIVRRFALDRATPFKRGTYLFPTDLIVARGPELKIYPLAKLTRLDPVHHYTNGVYNYTAINFYFEGGHAETFVVPNKARAEQQLYTYDQTGVMLSGALRDQDWGRVASLDILYEARQAGVLPEPGQSAPAPAPGVAGPTARAVPWLLRWASVPALAVSVLAVPTWIVRNVLSDDAAWRDVQSCGSVACVEDYIRAEGRHAEEAARTALPAAAFREAQRTGTVEALRDFVRAYPSSAQAGQARQVIHERFESVRASFNSQAATSDANMLVFMGQLLTWLEAHDSPPVRVRFYAPSTLALAAVDAALPRGVTPISPHFSQELSEPRERSITTVLERGFAAVFPRDVMSLEHAGRVVEGAPPETEHATIDVAYIVAPSGTVYVDRVDGRQFVGIVIEFTVRMSIPGSTTTHTFALLVEPPETFSVSYDSYGGGPSEGAVYSAMASRAFDQLGSRLPMVFFRPDSPAYQQAVAGSAPPPAPSY